MKWAGMLTYHTGREADSNDAFKKIPETFTSILQSKGAFAATKTMVTLLFSE